MTGTDSRPQWHRPNLAELGRVEIPQDLLLPQPGPSGLTNPPINGEGGSWRNSQLILPQGDVADSQQVLYLDPTIYLPAPLDSWSRSPSPPSSVPAQSPSEKPSRPASSPASILTGSPKIPSSTSTVNLPPSGISPTNNALGLDFESEYSPEHPLDPSLGSKADTPDIAGSASGLVNSVQAGLPMPNTTKPESKSDWYFAVQTGMFVVLYFVAESFPRHLYLHFLLRIPSLYFSRVARIFEDAQLSLPDIKRMALATADEWNPKEGPMFLAHHDQTTLPRTLLNFRSSWEGFIDSLMREWKTLNIIAVLLLSAILTMLQIGAAAHPITRTSALFSLICALVSLLYGCMYIIRFGTMRKMHKASSFANEAQKNTTSIWWNVWVLLAMPAIWLAWSIIMFLTCIMSFVWLSGSGQDDFNLELSPHAALGTRIGLTVVLALALVYFALIVKTFHRYGDALDHEWVRTVNEWAKEGAGAQRNQQLLLPSGPPPPPWMGPTVPPPQTPPWGAPTWGMPGMVPPPPWGSSPYNGPGPSPVIPFIPPQHADADPWTTSPPNFCMPSPRSPYASGSPAADFTEQPPQDSPARDQNPNPTFIIADTSLNPRSPTLPTEDGEGSGMDEGADSGDFGMMEQDSPIPRASTNVVDHLNPFEAGADYGPVLEPFHVRAAHVHLRLNPFLQALPASEGGPHLEWDMLFPSTKCWRSDETGHVSWSNGREEPLTFPRVTSIRLISSALPGEIEVLANNPDIGVTCGEVVDCISRDLHKFVGSAEFWELPLARNRSVLHTYWRTRLRSDGVPEGLEEPGLRRVDLLRNSTIFGGLRENDTLVKSVYWNAVMPCVFELVVIPQYPLQEIPQGQHHSMPNVDPALMLVPVSRLNSSESSNSRESSRDDDRRRRRQDRDSSRSRSSNRHRGPSLSHPSRPLTSSPSGRRGRSRPRSRSRSPSPSSGHLP
ncbi:hypothetical protein B0H13DRAFT_243382 [Mycena leptocephala]|nr:hypothetical protein B0H13DRAFT_243382 [Mycena leptocephala]